MDANTSAVGRDSAAAGLTSGPVVPNHGRAMFGSIGFPEILLILVLALLIFGPKRLPEVGRTIGKGLAEFRRASSDLKRTVNAELALDGDEHTRTSRRPETPRALAGGAATAAAPAAATSEEAAPEPGAPRAPENTMPRMTAPVHPEVLDEAAAQMAEEKAAAEAAPSPEPAPEGPHGADAEEEPAATTH
jgi:TatA/E family protein of Tat protein translocase